MIKSEFPASENNMQNLKYCGNNSGRKSKSKSKLVSRRKTALVWKIKARGHVGEITKLQKSKYSLGLSPAERWITFGLDKSVLFPLESTKPEVYKERHVLPKTIPRKVAIEQIRNENVRADINRIISKRNVDPLTLIPPNVVMKTLSCNEQFTFSTYTSVMPLHVFDNQDLECMTPEKWMAKGVVNNTPYSIPAIAFVPAAGTNLKTVWTYKDVVNSYEWTPVAVTGYNKDTNMWSVMTLNLLKKKHKLPRIYVFFKAESPKQHERRMLDALEYRTEVEMELRLQLYVDSMPTFGVPDVPKCIVQKINDFIGPKYLTKYRGKICEMRKDLKMDYKRSLCEMELRQLAAGKFSIFFPLPIKKQEMYISKEKGTIVTNLTAFLKLKKHFQWVNLFTIPNTYYAILDVVQECLKTDALCLYTTRYQREVALDDFRLSQSDHVKRTVRHLENVWVKNTTQYVISNLRTGRKSWFDIKEGQWDVYLVSKLRRLMQLIRFRMQESLANLVMSSVDKYVDLLTLPCLCTLRCKNVRNLVWGTDLINSPYVPPHGVSCLFTVTLSLNDKRACYSTHASEFLPVILECFQDALYRCHFIDQIEPYVMENLHFCPDSYLSSVGLLNPYILAAKTKLTESYACAIMPLRAYLREYNQFVEFYKLDIVTYLKRLKGKCAGLEIKHEISCHLNAMSKLQEMLPAEIIIGPFLVKVDVLREDLIKKRYELANAIMEMYANVLYDRIEEINSVYHNIHTKLLVIPRNIEQVVAQREFVSKIKQTVREQEALLLDVSKEYEILDYFYYVCSDKELDSRIKASLGPARIEKEVVVCLLMLDMCTDKFYKVHVTKEQLLDEQIDAIKKQVAGLAFVHNTKKISEIGVSVAKLHKYMKEAVETSKVLQARQALFDVPVRKYTELQHLRECFRPFHQLWKCAAETVKGYSVWFSNLLVTIDVDLMENNINTNLKAAEQSIIAFEHLPDVQHVAYYIRKLLLDVKPFVGIARAVKNPNMKQEHWKQFYDLTRIDIDITQTTTLAFIRHAGAAEHVDLITEISNTATREFRLAEALRLKQSNERFFKTLLLETIVIDLDLLYKRSLNQFVSTIIEEMLLQAEKSILFSEIYNELVDRANKITYQNISIHIKDILEKCVMEKLEL